MTWRPGGPSDYFGRFLFLLPLHVGVGRGKFGQPIFCQFAGVLKPRPLHGAHDPDRLPRPWRFTAWKSAPRVARGTRSGQGQWNASCSSATTQPTIGCGGPLCTVLHGGTRAVLDRPALKLNTDSLPAIARSARSPARRSAARGAVRTKRRTPPSQTWSTFLTNHVRDLVFIDFFTVPTAGLRVLFVLVVLAHHRRRVVHFNVTEHSTAHWTSQQIVDARTTSAP